MTPAAVPDLVMPQFFLKEQALNRRMGAHSLEPLFLACLRPVAWVLGKDS